MKADWPSENIILGLLAERPMHGYELSNFIRKDEALQAIWRMERSEVYFLLGKLVKSGYIAESATDDADDARRPARVVYAPTEAGREVLALWLRTPEQYPRNLRTGLLARVYIALRQDPAAALELIAAQEQVLQRWLAHAAPSETENEVVAVVHRFRAAQVQAALAALNELRGLAKSRRAAVNP